MGWPQRVVSAASWAAIAGRMRAWYSAWADSRSGPDSARVGVGVEVERGPQPAEDVQAVQAQLVLRPAGAEDREVAVAGPVHALDPVPQAGHGVGWVAVGGFAVPGLGGGRAPAAGVVLAVRPA